MDDLRQCSGHVTLRLQQCSEPATLRHSGNERCCVFKVPSEHCFSGPCLESAAGGKPGAQAAGGGLHKRRRWPWEAYNPPWQAFRANQQWLRRGRNCSTFGASKRHMPVASLWRGHCGTQGAAWAAIRRPQQHPLRHGHRCRVNHRIQVVRDACLHGLLLLHGGRGKLPQRGRLEPSRVAPAAATAVWLKNVQCQCRLRPLLV